MTTDTIISLFNQSTNILFFLHLFFLVGMSLLLLQKNIHNKIYNRLFFISSVAYFLIFQSNSLQIFLMAGDNICQIAYWKILFHPNLTGSIGASYTKPGQLLVLGTLYELSGIFGEAAFRIGLCLIMASCVWCLSQIATSIGGREAGIISFLTASWVFLPELMAGSYSIFLIPTIFFGLKLYFFNPKDKILGRILLAVSIQFHIQAITVLAVVWLLLLIKKKLKELVSFSMAVIASLAVWMVVILRVQGTVERINSGIAAGYVAPFGDVFAYNSKLDYIFKTVGTELTNNYTICTLLFLAAIGIAGSCRHRYKVYISVFSIVILLVINVVMLGGSINLGRYFSLVYAFSCSVGVAVLVKFTVRFNKNIPYALTVFALITFIFSRSSSSLSSQRHIHLPSQSDYVTTASKLLNDRNMPFSTRIMTEDDLLYPIVAQFPDRYPSLTALQYFNVVNEASRKQILSRTDYIWIVTNNRHPYYYLSHIPLPAWQTDRFRLMAYKMMQDHQPNTLYGFLFTPIEIDGERLLIMVKPCKLLN